MRREGWIALTERLGVSGAIRFMMQYDPGHGDYTEERRRLFAVMEHKDADTRLFAIWSPGPDGKEFPGLKITYKRRK